MAHQFLRASILLLGTVSAALSAAGCSGGVNDPAPSATTVDEALSAVKTCQAQARACPADGGASSCEDQLRSCLMSALPKAGGRTGQKMPDASGVSPVSPQNDAGASHPAAPPTAASAASATPRATDVDSAKLVCIDAMHTCLGSAAPPSACAHQAHACLTGARDAADGG